MSGVDSEFVMTASRIFDERVTLDHNRRGPIGTSTAHRSQSRFEASVVILDPIVRIMLSVMNHSPGTPPQFVTDPQQRSSQIDSDLQRSHMRDQRCGEEVPGCTKVSSL